MLRPESEFQCSDCGGDVYRGDKVCQQCGANLEWDTLTEGPGDQVRCRNCGAAVLPDQSACAACGAALREIATPLTFASMTLGDIFSRTIQIIGKVFFRYLSVVAVIFVPVSVLAVLALNQFYSHLGALMRQETSGGIGTTMGMMFLAFGLVGLAYIAGTVAVTTIVRSEIHGTKLGWQDVLASTTGIHFWRAVGQTIVILLGFGAMLLVLAMFLSLFGGSGLKFLLVLAFMLVAFVVVLHIFIRLSFSITAVVCENAGALQGLGRSWSLVWGTWWRVFGIMMLMGLMTRFAIMVVSAPVSLIAFWDFYREYFGMLQVGSGGSNVEMMSRTFESMGFGVGVSMMIDLVLSVLVMPIYTTLLYYDLRSRLGEFDPSRASLIFGINNAQPPTEHA